MPRIVDLPAHLQGSGQLGKIGAQCRVADSRVFRHKMHAHEKKLRLLIAKLGGITDIATAFSQKPGHAMDDAALVWARQGKNVFRMHHELDYGMGVGGKDNRAKAGIVAWLALKPAYSIIIKIALQAS